LTTQRLADLYQSAFNKSDVKSIMALYAPDAMRLGPDGQLLKGHAAIEKGYVDSFSGPLKGSKLSAAAGCHAGAFSRRSSAVLLECWLTFLRDAGVAQLVEQLIRNQQVIGSSPIAGSSFPQQNRSFRQQFSASARRRLPPPSE
jgi:hypothetical protein